ERTALNRQILNVSAIESTDWSIAKASWYGPPNGAGTDGGACGYKSAVGKFPFSSMVSSGGPSLFKSGQGCGDCYEVKCTSNAACSQKPVTILISDECPGCVSESAHFDMSGTAFGAMAISGKADQLRNVGVFHVQYRRTECNYPGQTPLTTSSIKFRIDAGANPYYFSTVVEYLNGDGNLASMELEEASNKDTWHQMDRLRGAVWKLNSGSELKGPFSIRMKAADCGKVLVASNVIPVGWKPGDIYWSHVNY
ncbi:Expansin-b15, partial [Thalictrum thalictroides]